MRLIGRVDDNSAVDQGVECVAGQPREPASAGVVVGAPEHDIAVGKQIQALPIIQCLDVRGHDGSKSDAFGIGSQDVHLR